MIRSKIDSMNKFSKGAVSLFIVVFFSLLITVVTIGFIRITLKDTQQTNTVDLSQSAYDSAQAGVEDAKRALIRLGNVCGSTGTPADCTLALADIYSTKCNQALNGIVSEANGEVKVQQTSGDTATALDQAYTCVTITKDTKDYLGSLNADESKTVPLVGAADFDRVRIEWFTSNNLSSGTTSVDMLKLSDLASMSPKPLPVKDNSSYPQNRPPIMKAHLVQAGSSFQPSALENPSNVSTMYFYPVSAIISGVASIPFSDGGRQTPTKAPTLIGCQSSLATGGYACTVELILPSRVTVGSTALLQLSSLYNTTDYRVTMYDGTTLVKFDGIQPMVDSTGRANDLFRRVQVRVEGVDSYPYPDATVETSGNLCKNFYITDDAADYWQSACNP